MSLLPWWFLGGIRGPGVACSAAVVGIRRVSRLSLWMVAAGILVLVRAALDGTIVSVMTVRRCQCDQGGAPVSESQMGGPVGAW